MINLKFAGHKMVHALDAEQDGLDGLEVSTDNYYYQTAFAQGTAG